MAPVWRGRLLALSAALSRGTRGFSLTATHRGLRRPLGKKLRSTTIDKTLPPRYDFKEFEESLYRWWEDEGMFEPRGEKESYTLPMPPPNVTGRLHLGHAMFIALQDILARFHRMRGRSTLWLPGTDHAGIATQLSVEKSLPEGVSRFDMGREKFLEKVWQWKDENGGAITSQMRRLGASADWSRERFTLEPAMSKAVTEAFVRLYDKGLVYRGTRMVNWSPNLKTAVSDLEVETIDRTGKLYYFRYPLDNGDYLSVATTRPETILGDVAICVNPSDERYGKYIGQFAKVPLIERRIPIIADEYVDPEFGTGVLKITPGHDANDYAIGKRHDLPIISIFEPDATVSEGFGKYSGLDRFECRKEFWKDMDDAGLTIHVEENHAQRVPISQRGGEVIEPMVSTQWFVNATNMAAKASEAVRSGAIQIVPPRFEKDWYNWLDNIQDWCVSRQLWWGHQVPAWYSTEDSDVVVVARDEAEARQRLSDMGKDATMKLRRDDDVLDTWFSSGLWPFATVGWPDESAPDFRRFYPANCLETGYDILFFWVARMVMLGIEFTGKPPFDTIYMHGLVRDADGQKMSKTKGNVVDPLDVVETYGADALRFTLVTGVTPGQDVPLSMDKVEQNRNFANKLWNVGRFVEFRFNQRPAEDAAGDVTSSDAGLTLGEMEMWPLPEKYIVSKAHQVARDVAKEIDEYAVGEAGRRVYEFLWDELADWYVEVSKTRDLTTEKGRISCQALGYAFDVALKMIHPFMPHVTEFLWQRVLKSSSSQKKALMLSPWPTTDAVDEDAIDDFAAWKDLVRALRNLRAEYGVEPKSTMATTIVVSRPGLADAIEEENGALALLAKVDPARLVVVAESPPDSGDAARLVIADGLEAYVPYEDLKTVKDVAKERDRLEKQLAKLEKDIAGLDARLSKPGFVDKAPAHIVDEARETLREKNEQRSAILDALKALDDDDQE